MKDMNRGHLTQVYNKKVFQKIAGTDERHNTDQKSSSILYNDKEKLSDVN